VAKKFTSERLASWRTRSGMSSGRCSTRNRAKPSVICIAPRSVDKDE